MRYTGPATGSAQEPLDGRLDVGLGVVPVELLTDEGHNLNQLRDRYDLEVPRDRNTL